MAGSKLEFENEWLLTENSYCLETEANHAALMTTGNGYMGIRGSLEEYGSLGIQGCYIRGVMDKIVEVRLTLCDNLYMKKYYVEEEKQKEFEKQESIINLIDFLLIRFTINGETFYPWEGNIISWKRTLDLKRNCLVRNVVWENRKGEQTQFRFLRFSSFEDDHIYAIKAEVTPLNYSGNIEILSGFDLRTKTNGQKITRPINTIIKERTLLHENLVGEHYGFRCMTGAVNDFYGADAAWGTVQDEKCVAHTINFDAEKGKTYTLEKKIYIITSRDTDEEIGSVIYPAVSRLSERSFEDLFSSSMTAYQRLFHRMDIQIEGDKEADRAVRFSNYHTLISIARNDHVHSLSAKGLTGEIYNNFVWWDAEIYQAPVFMQTLPELVPNVLRYRYEHLDEARKAAREEGRRGARFPFTSGVTGEETVWIDVRHPFMQVHCVSDIGMGILKYYTCTGDEEFMTEYGMEMLLEICRYWADRVTYNSEKNRYEILQVTGTDEHHPYVDNDAYTNYCVYGLLKETMRLLDQMESRLVKVKEKIGWKESEREKALETADRLYLPYERATDMIPQFDGYFQLDKGLEVSGGSKSGYTQMKQAGLYHKSQVIKQPDVMILFAYHDMEFNHRAYCRNWDYYEARCEAASSLSYCIHSICASDLEQPERAYRYLMQTARMDLDDEHGGTKDGIHSGCAAGAWMAVVRGIAGMKMKEDEVTFSPHFLPWWDKVSFHAVWKGQLYAVEVTNDRLKISADPSNKGRLAVRCAGERKLLGAGEELEVLFAGQYTSGTNWR